MPLPELNHSVGDAYGRSASAWVEGPDEVYRRYAQAIVEATPVPLRGRLVLDVGAGAGAVCRSLRVVGAVPIAVDLAAAMLVAARSALGGLPSVAADATSLPFATDRVGAVVSAFCLNHLARPQLLLREAARVTRPGGAVLASTFAGADTHPVKAIVDAAAQRFGWRAPAWYATIRDEASPLTETASGLLSVALEAGLPEPGVRSIIVDTGLSTPEGLVKWRLGMAHLAPFVAALDRSSRESLIGQAQAGLGPRPQSLRREVLIVWSVLAA